MCKRVPRGPGIEVGRLVTGCEDEAREENDGLCEVINEHGALDQPDVKKGPGRTATKAPPAGSKHPFVQRKKKLR